MIPSETFTAFESGLARSEAGFTLDAEAPQSVAPTETVGATVHTRRARLGDGRQAPPLSCRSLPCRRLPRPLHFQDQFYIVHLDFYFESFILKSEMDFLVFL